ncbi:hypothetical protein [Microbulbifer thermotolerans]|uniref:Uncharacterized protein n=1 Tax=Microbulbifer thermotolerans TaxID=252514 RepID=A0AB35HZG3_MICTH|nr:hypothetical protein [Microbulbifer thermotolerans]MCX2780359.1 hypothetical protein [Microbulbifer thermotolerans]MCX2782518.1 hypothetical protein [Microbulbifer thermotolerans]MCX2794530.1 hypothetical protein [Microbulbifer thermotolerans]MCX2802192.1 hypothetical protein [Microbulbifer thermotolerans]MCX2805969.1 hypothetical protein [Microbulbifer thermotolerans]
MKTLINIVSQSIGAGNRNRAEAVKCNYADNYYGDQVCTLSR